jgi:ketosteroid isomerase-like protein
VEQAFQGFIRAFNTLDWDAFSEFLAPDVSLFNPDIPAATTLHRNDGKQQVSESYRKVFDAARNSGQGPDIVPRDVRVQQLSGAAIVTFEFDRGHGSFGRRTLVFVQTSGGWKLQHIHASNTKPDGT